MTRFTKITASIGPSCENINTLTQMIKAGVNVCRLNFSHDTNDVQGAKIDMIRSVAKNLGVPVAIMIDIQGPKHRIGDFESEKHYPLKIGQKFILDSDSTPGDETRVQLPDLDVIHSLNIGDRILLNDGKIELRVDAVFDDAVETTVMRGDEIWSRRGFNGDSTKYSCVNAGGGWSLMVTKKTGDTKELTNDNLVALGTSGYLRSVKKPTDFTGCRSGSNAGYYCTDNYVYITWMSDASTCANADATTYSVSKETVSSTDVVSVMGANPGLDLSTSYKCNVYKQ